MTTVNLLVTPSGGSPTIQVELQLLYYEAAFEENNLYGAPKDKVEQSGGAGGGAAGTVI
jgi:hypothetical protein